MLTLTTHRIIAPGKGPKPVVFLQVPPDFCPNLFFLIVCLFCGYMCIAQHGLLCSSADWVIGARSKAFGFLLADAGYHPAHGFIQVYFFPWIFF